MFSFIAIIGFTASFLVGGHITYRAGFCNTTMDVKKDEVDLEVDLPNGEKIVDVELKTTGEIDVEHKKVYQVDSLQKLIDMKTIQRIKCYIS
jgi:hypothetical protein